MKHHQHHEQFYFFETKRCSNSKKYEKKSQIKKIPYYNFSTSTEKSATESDFPHKGHLLEKLPIVSFNDLSSFIVFIIFPQLPHSISTDRLQLVKMSI